MKNFRKKQPPEARFGFYGDCSPDGSAIGLNHCRSFSMGVFPIEPKAGGKGWKKGRGVCRIEAKHGQSLAAAKRTAELVCRVLEAGVTLPRKRYKAGLESDGRLVGLLKLAGAWDEEVKA